MHRAQFSLLGLLAFVGLIGCGGMDGEGGEAGWGEAEIDEIGNLEQALSSNCGTFSPQQTFTGSVARTTVTAATQGQGCEGDSFIFDIDRYDAGAFLTPSVSPAVFPDIATQCTSTSVQYFVWERTARNVIFLGSTSQNGSFDPFLGCFLSVSSPVTLVGNRDYRFGVTVRRPSNVLQDLTVFSPTSLR